MPDPQSQAVTYSVVIPIFNEEAALPALFDRLDPILDRLDGPAEVIFVDDGSTDRGAAMVAQKAERDDRYRLVSLSRNFGHQIAITAGMDLASGQAVVVMDADLQDPPELLIEMIAKWKSGYEVVFAQRISREGESVFKRWTAKLFYLALRRLSAVDIPLNVGDFRLVDRKALEVFRHMPEHDRFVRGMFGWMGFRQTSVPFHRPIRVAGETKYPLHKMFSLSLHGVIGFSDVPLRLALWLGFGISAISGLLCLYVFALVVYDAKLVQGWASTLVVVSLLSGVNLLMTGIVGLYVGRIHAEVKNRPLYVVGRTIGFRNPQSSGQSARFGGPPL
jgi:glycosyltransferase involved in cell wall biosynthesis